MSEGLLAEDVKEAIDRYDKEWATRKRLGMGTAIAVRPVIVAAARLWLASQEQTPDIDALVGEVEHRLLRRHQGGETITPERAVTEMLNVFDAALGFHPADKGDRDVVDPFVAETLYEEHIARNIEARGGLAATSDWPAWDELPDMGRDYWMGLAVAARLASKAALVGFHPGDKGDER